MTTADDPSVQLSVQERANENSAAPAPWSYHYASRALGPGDWDWIEDADGSIVTENIGCIYGPRIVRAVNEMARRDGIIT